MITLLNKIRDAMPHISKSVHRSTLIRSVGHSKFKTIATTHILNDELARLLTEIEQGQASMKAVAAWMEAASELKLIKDHKVDKLVSYISNQMNHIGSDPGQLGPVVSAFKVMAKNEIYETGAWGTFATKIMPVIGPRMARELEYIQLAYETDTGQALGPSIKPWRVTNGVNLSEYTRGKDRERFNLLNDVALRLKPLRTEVQMESQIGKFLSRLMTECRHLQR